MENSNAQTADQQPTDSYVQKCMQLASATGHIYNELTYILAFEDDEKYADMLDHLTAIESFFDELAEKHIKRLSYSHTGGKKE